MAMRHQGATVVAAAALVGVVSGCSSSAAPPKVSDFAPGSCRAAAPTVLHIGHLVSVANKQHGVHATTQQDFTDAQTQLRRLSVKPAGSDELITAIGFLRLRLDSHSYQPNLLTDIRAAQQAVQRTCVTAPAH